jgi:hypothetical protein
MQDHLESRPHRDKMDLVLRRVDEVMKVSDLSVAEDVKDVTVVADAWGQGVVVTLLSREINDNGVENQAKLINYVHQTL